MRRRDLRTTRGFTIIELMITAALIGVLAAIAIPSFMSYQLRTKRSEAMTNLAGIGRTHLSAGRTEQALVWALRALEANPQFEQAWATTIACYALLGQDDEVRRALADLAVAIPDATIGGMIHRARTAHEGNLRDGLGKALSQAQPLPAGA